MPKAPLNLLSTAIGCALLLGACSAMKPHEYSKDEQRQRIVADQAQMYAEQEPVTTPITLYEAAARALKYNLDYRLKLMEGALAADLRDVSSHEMLPRLVASAGYAGRNNDSGGTSIGIEDREESLRASTSEERYRELYGLGLSWSLLDFGVAYYRTQQKSDQILMAEERRRKVAQNVLQDVRNAYWRAVGAQRLMPQVDRLLVRTHQALLSARQAEGKGLLPRQEVLAYQRALLDSIYLLTVRRQDLEFAQSELAALMSLPPGSRLILADSSEPALPVLDTDIGRLEQLSLENRPEIMEEWYRKRVNENDLKIAKAQLWPNVAVDVGYRYDSNKYLYNSNWTETGLQVSLNLLRLLQLPSINRAAESQGKTDDMRRVALSMAILTQVRVGTLRYQLARQEVEFADQSLRVDQSLLDYAQAARNTTYGSELELIRAEGRYLLSRYQREAAYSSAQAAWGRLYNSVGLNVLPEEIDKHDIKSLSQALQKTLDTQEHQSLLLSQQGTANVVRR
ncbi:TolC family protein [Pseudomonas sp. NPDC087612]|uniref:TolC family protein n=1 Tax=unclassified Pseudomonas TaxID=196821 RepID=UPI0005EBBFA0|nr:MULTISPECIES: TolC family protein [unclassified Pseudomonas]KJK19229.1 membrane protein [Pseudomonas sp. 2(2015)]QVM98454.1 TolC family protein [Pseudomonas sp. SORT22]UVL54668.1 TolC family protein [Pseudomonas sp. B21-035]SDQ56021.1 Outer membrane protein TolC [Pseudomonas sp. UC 17F4]